MYVHYLYISDYNFDFSFKYCISFSYFAMLHKQKGGKDEEANSRYVP